MTMITPKNWTKYKGYPVILRKDGKKVTGILVSMSSKGTTIERPDHTRTTRKGWIVSAQMMTAPQVAALFGLTPQALRYHLRKSGAFVGKGGKYSFDPVDVATMAEWFE